MCFCLQKCLAERANSLGRAAGEGAAALSVRVLTALTAGGARDGGSAPLPGAAPPAMSQRDFELMLPSSILVVATGDQGAGAGEGKRGTQPCCVTGERSGFERLPLQWAGYTHVWLG